MKLLKLSLLLLLGAAVATCGGGGGGSSGGGSSSSSSSSGGAVPNNTFTDASIIAGDNPKQLTFNWMFNGSAVAFRLEGNPDGASGFSQLDISGDGVVDADNIGSADFVDGSASELNLPIKLLQTDLINARYQIVALDNDGDELDRSDELSIMEVANETLVGYFKATNSQQGDAFGYSVAVSSEGDILAVGAPYEESDADGISTDGTGEDNNDAPGAGAVYIFSRNENGAWEREAYIKASNSDQGDSFGFSISMSSDGDTLVVGAPYEDSSYLGVSTDGTGEDNNGLDGAGAVYVFTRDENKSWSQQAYIKASNAGELDYFGYSVSLGHSPIGYIMVVGAPYEDSDFQGVSTDGTGEADNDATVAGAAYVFRRDDGAGGQWSQHAYLKASNAEGNDNFGRAVAVSGNGVVLAVAAPQERSAATGINGDEDDDSAMSAGAVYVFNMSGGTTWFQQAYVKASNTDENDFFGRSVSLSVMGDTLAVGAHSESSNATGVSTNGDGENDDSAPGAGAVYLFTRDDMFIWSQQAYIKASNTHDDANFGDSVDLSGPGDTLAVGAPKEDNDAVGVSVGSSTGNNGASDSGAVYVFTRDGNDWTQYAYIKASNTELNDGFGRSVGLVNDEILAVGASGEDSNSSAINGDQNNNDADGSGAVYLY